VDDEIAVGEFMRELLGTRGLDATFVTHPQAALELVAASPARFAAVITDQSMPRMTGVQLARALHEVRPGLPIILYSGYSDGLTAPDLQVAAIQTVLPKPVDPAALESALWSALSRR
jgi:DNA-binding NtrC family response regulator